MGGWGECGSTRVAAAAGAGLALAMRATNGVRGVLRFCRAGGRHPWGAVQWRLVFSKYTVIFCPSNNRPPASRCDIVITVLREPFTFTLRAHLSPDFHEARWALSQT